MAVAVGRHFDDLAASGPDEFVDGRTVTDGQPGLYGDVDQGRLVTLDESAEGDGAGVVERATDV